MVVALDPELEAALTEASRQCGVPAEKLAIESLRERFIPRPNPRLSHDEFLRLLKEGARDYGVSIPDSALTSEALYD